MHCRVVAFKLLMRLVQMLMFLNVRLNYLQMLQRCKYVFAKVLWVYSSNKKIIILTSNSILKKALHSLTCFLVLVVLTFWLTDLKCWGILKISVQNCGLGRNFTIKIVKYNKFACQLTVVLGITVVSQCFVFSYQAPLHQCNWPYAFAFRSTRGQPCCLVLRNAELYLPHVMSFTVIFIIYLQYKNSS